MTWSRMVCGMERGGEVASDLHRCNAVGRALAEIANDPESWKEYAADVHAVVDRTDLAPEMVGKVLAELDGWDVVPK